MPEYRPEFQPMVKCGECKFHDGVNRCCRYPKYEYRTDDQCCGEGRRKPATPTPVKKHVTRKKKAKR